jgi:transcriptional regulator with GAF, ATPase, and Fis domain
MFEMADDGTNLLAGDMDVHLQAKLLRAPAEPISNRVFLLSVPLGPVRLPFK